MTKENPNLRMYGALNPVKRMLLHPEQFDPDKLTVNEIEQSDGRIIAKIPDFPGHVTRRKKQNSNEYYIELILSSRYDPETKQNRNKKVIIGTDISYYLRGMMFANEQYHDYIDVRGRVLPHIAAAWAEEEKERRKREAPPPAPMPQPTAPEPESAPEPDPEPEPEPPEEPEEEGEADEVQIQELRQREEALDAREAELNRREKELESQQMVRRIKMNQAIEDHIDFLRSILNRHSDIMEEQAKRRPDKPMSLKQVRTINELLQELKDLFKGSEAEDLLHLAEEPKEDDNTAGTTYGEMALLLNAYGSMLSAFSIGKLRSK